MGRREDELARSRHELANVEGRGRRSEVVAHKMGGCVRGVFMTGMLMHSAAVVCREARVGDTVHRSKSSRLNLFGKLDAAQSVSP